MLLLQQQSKLRVASGSSCSGIFISCSKCCSVCDTKIKMCFNGHKKKVHIQIFQDEPDGLFLWFCLTKTAGEFTVGNKGLSLNQQWMFGSHVILWWQPEESNLAWPQTASGESHVQDGLCFLAPWKEQVIELQPLQASSTQQQYWVAEELLATDKPPAVSYSYKLLVREMAT